MVCAFKNFITDRTSQSAGAGIRASIFNSFTDATVSTREIPLVHAPCYVIALSRTCSRFAQYKVCYLWDEWESYFVDAPRMIILWRCKGCVYNNSGHFWHLLWCVWVLFCNLWPLGLLIALYAQTHAERVDIRNFVFLLHDWLNQLCQLAITDSTQTAEGLNAGIFGEKPGSNHITANLWCLLLQTLQSVMNLLLFYDIAYHWSWSCDFRLLYLMPIVFKFSLTESIHLIAGLPTCEVPSGLCRVNFCEGSAVHCEKVT
jgi:hypothetical protein